MKNQWKLQKYKQMMVCIDNNKFKLFSFYLSFMSLLELTLLVLTMTTMVILIRERHYSYDLYSRKK